MPNQTGKTTRQDPSIRRAAEGGAAPAHLAFLRSACGTAQGIIRLTDEKVGYALRLLGILVAALALRAEVLVSLTTGPRHPLIVRGLFLAGCLLFLGSAGTSLIYAARTRTVSTGRPTDVPRLLSHLTALEMDHLAEELARGLHKAAGLVQRRLALTQKCLSWAAVAFATWAIVLALSVAL